MGWLGRNRVAMLALAGCLSAGCVSARPLSQAELDLALIRAAEAGDIAGMKRLLSAGADINAADAEGWTPYLAASSMGHFEAMRMLKALGARTHVDEGPPVAPPI